MNTSARSGGRRTMTRAFRNRMFKQAGMLFAALVAVLLILVGTVGRLGFLIGALVLIPATALTFNFMQRRAYRAEHRRR